MKTSNRIALLAGASVTAIGLATPAFGQAAPPATFPNFVICPADAPDPTPFAPDCTYGVILGTTAAPLAGPQTATVNTPATGQVEQILAAPTVDIDIINNGDT